MAVKLYYSFPYLDINIAFKVINRSGLQRRFRKPSHGGEIITSKGKDFVITKTQIKVT